MDALRSGFNTLNPPVKDKSIDSASMIKSFMKG